jgi:uncharacterized protein YraI
MRLIASARGAVRGLAAGVALLLTLGASAAALAAPANITANAHLRAGPSVEYPVVALLPPGAPVQVYGCEQEYTWCDIQAGPDRGWVAGAYLQMASANGALVVAGNGPVLGLPIVTFSFDTYWGTYYRTRPWYANRAHWYPYWHRYPHGRPPPPPRPPVVRPPRPVPPPVVRPPRPRPQPPVARPPRPNPDPGRPRPNPRPPGDGRPPDKDSGNPSGPGGR